MIILGLHDNHSASVCLLVDGEVVAVACIYQSYNDFATKRYPKFKIKNLLGWRKTLLVANIKWCKSIVSLLIPLLCNMR